MAKSIDPLSLRSLMIRLKANGTVIASGTGFIMRHKDILYLVTNWHNLTGKNAETQQPMSPSGILPDQVEIVHHGQSIGQWVSKTENLYDGNGTPRWKEHPSGSVVDVVALPLTEVAEPIKFYVFDMRLANTNILPQVSMTVYILGYPLGLAGAGDFPVWKTGHIASEYFIDYKNSPCFLVDATTRGGMSGSPVFIRMFGGYDTEDGTHVVSSSQVATRFLGVYSGRIHKDSEIGRVWRAKVLEEILK